LVADCDQLLVQVADTVLRQGQGMHGSFKPRDTLNFTAAIGRRLKAGYVDALPQQRRCRRDRGESHGA